MKTTVTELENSRVRVEVEVAPDAIESAIQKATRSLGKELRMPGFRKGKVPAPVVLQRLGREAVLDEAVRTTLGRWYAEAVRDSSIHPVGDPDLKLDGLPAEGEPLAFSFEIGVRPTAKLGDYKGIEVPKDPVEPDDEAVDAELESLRERAARLDTVEEVAANGDYVVIDYAGTVDGEPLERGEARDHMVEIGGGHLIPGFEDGLVGLSAGDEKTLELTFPDDYNPPVEGEPVEIAGRPVSFAITVKEVKRKTLPELDDAFAEESAGFDSLVELRDDVASKLRERAEQQVEASFREAVLDAVVGAATVEVPDDLIQARATELVDRTLHSLAHQGITKEIYLQISGKTEEELQADAADAADQSLRREAVLAAVIAAEGIEASDGDVLDALAEPAARESMAPEKLRERLDRDGRLDSLREELAERAAVELLALEAKPVDPDRAAAREQIWTPDKG